MQGSRWRKPAGALLLGTLAVLLMVGPATADDKQVEELKAHLLEMKARLDRLEKQNEELRKNQATPGGPYSPVSAPEPDQAEKEKINKAIDSYLKDKDAKAKAEQDAKELEKQEIGIPVGSDLGMKATWNNGVWFETANKDFRFHIGGTLQIDAAAYQSPGDLQSGPGSLGGDFFQPATNIRRGRLRAEGTAYEVVDFLFELEFFNGFALPTTPPVNPPPNANIFNGPGPTDAWITMKQLPVIGNVRVGNMKEPFSLEHLNSYRYLEFMERSLIFDAFVPNTFNNGFNPGVMMFNNLGPDNRGTWWAGVFKATATPEGFGFGHGGVQYAGRLTYLPIYDDEAHWWHVETAGVGGGLPDNGQIRLRARDSIRNGPFPLLAQIANTGVLTGNSQYLWNIGTAAVCGPWTVEAEATANWITNAAQLAALNGVPPAGHVGTYFAQGAYVQVLYFLTGDNRTYDKYSATLNRVIPLEPFFWVDGCRKWLFGTGAWEVGVRYSYLDMTNKGINGGLLNDVTVGLNWYLNPNAKIQWNYDVITRAATGGGHPSDVIQGLGTRLSFDF